MHSPICGPRVVAMGMCHPIMVNKWLTLHKAVSGAALASCGKPRECALCG